MRAGQQEPADRRASDDPDARRASGGRAPGADSLAELVELAQRGDRRASAQLLEALAPRVLGVASRVFGRATAEAEDAAQEAMVEILRALPRFRGDSSVLHYATRIAVRSALSLGKRDRARARRESLAPAAEDTPVPTPSDGVLAARRREALRTLLSHLPDEQAEALSLQVVAGMSLEEIGQTMGVPVNTVRSRIRRAKEGLRHRIDRNPTYRELLK